MNDDQVLNLDELNKLAEKEYPLINRSHHKLGCTFFISRRNWGHDGITADGMIILFGFVHVSYRYEPEYVQAHTANVGYYLGGGRSLMLSFSWPRL